VLPSEVAASGRLAGRGFGQFVARLNETHHAIAGRVFGLLERSLGAATLPVRLAHDGIAELAYGATRLIGELTLAAVGEGAALAIPAEEGGVRTRVVLGALNGVWGDYLAATGSPLAMPMTARVHGPAAPRLAVFIHGLCETEDGWFLFRGRSEPYGARLRRALGFTPVYVRYNSGLPIAENGRRLSELLDELVRDSPVPVSEIVLIGHSMGGLVARAACLTGAGNDWGRRLRHIVALGTPHRGAPLEQAAAQAVRVLRQLPETRPLAVAIDSRSRGIKDLARPEVAPYSMDVEHYFFSAGLGRAVGGRMEQILGDLFVPRLSAWDSAAGEAARFAVDRYQHLGGVTHFDLLNHPAIGEQLVRWLGAGNLLSTGEVDIEVG
jgi:pimeloyl-ACP methyl ester carboxylesterase